MFGINLTKGMFKAETTSKYQLPLQSAKKLHNTNFKTNSVILTTEDHIFISFDKIKNVSGIPTPGQQVRIITQKQFNSFDFVLAILKNETIKYLYISLYRIGRKVLKELIECKLLIY